MTRGHRRCGLSQRLAKQGYTADDVSPLTIRPSDRIEASLWSVPEPVVAAGRALPRGRGRLRRMCACWSWSCAAKGREADAATNRAFFRNVLGSDVPELPQGIEPSDSVRVQVWTYLIPNVVEANKRLRASNIPVVFDPVAITTAYLGDHKTMAIRAPDGTIVELVETWRSSGARQRSRAQDLSRVHDVVRVERALDASHEIELHRIGIALELEHLQLADAVLGRKAAAELLHEVVDGALHLLLHRLQLRDLACPRAG